jgi:hypothetical protein
MEMTTEVLAVLAIVRRVLSTRTEWITIGQELMAEIEAKVKAHEPSDA